MLFFGKIDCQSTTKQPTWYLLFVFLQKIASDIESVKTTPM